MPAIENWITCPLTIIQRLYEEKSENHEERLQEYFLPKIREAQANGQLPSLNDEPTHNIPTNSVVSFRAMIQDMLDPEFYLGAYQTENVKTGIKSMKCGKFRDIAECGPHEEIKLESPANITLDRQTLYCIPVPGETTWVKQMFAKRNGSNQTTASTSVVPERTKRCLDDGEVETSCGQNGVSMETEMATSDGSSGDNKKTKTDSKKSKSEKESYDLNFPLPGENGPACLVKLYSSDESLKLNDIIEIVGVLSNDPAMATDPTQGRQSSVMDPESEVMEGLEDTDVTPPPSLVPRLHALTVRKLHHCNPLLQVNTHVETILSEAESLRQQLLTILSRLLFGDTLAAEYLLCHLVSTVYARQDVIALGKFALNISGCPKVNRFPTLLHGVIKELVSKCHLFRMTLDNMNTSTFVPHKDYKLNRLMTGLLQLSGRTHLVVDETALQPGQLDVNGVMNVTALGNVVTWQKVDYDFNFHKQAFQTDIITLVLSEGKSILKCDCQVPLIACQGAFPDDPEAHFQKVLGDDLSSMDLLNKFRAYIGLVQALQYELPADLQKNIEDDFVTSRKDDKSNMSVEDFHALLVLARLLSLTYGHKSLERETWERAKILEVNRKTRLVLTSGGDNRRS